VFGVDAELKGPVGPAEGSEADVLAVGVEIDGLGANDARLALELPEGPPIVMRAVIPVSWDQRSRPPWASMTCASSLSNLFGSPFGQATPPGPGYRMKLLLDKLERSSVDLVGMGPCDGVRAAFDDDELLVLDQAGQALAGQPADPVSSYAPPASG
jgi:hypothetical protein